jgi:hypothetical protein
MSLALFSIAEVPSPPGSWRVEDATYVFDGGLFTSYEDRLAAANRSRTAFLAEIRAMRDPLPHPLHHVGELRTDDVGDE